MSVQEHNMHDEFPDNLEFQESKFDGKDFSGSTVRDKDFIHCTFHSCQMTEITFQACRFQECIFDQCDLSLGKLERSIIQDTTFHKTRLVGIDWTKLAWRKKALKPCMHFIQCNLNYANFFGCSLKGCKLTDCMVHEADFAEADLSIADCRNSDFSKSRFFHTNLADADFREAQNYDIDAVANGFKNTKFSLPEAVSLLHSLDIILDED